MGNCHFTKWVDPPNYDHVDNYIGHLKNKIHELEYKVKALEDEAEKNALVVGLEDDPRCPDSFCTCPYHPRPSWPPNSPPSGGAGYPDPGGPSGYDPGGPSQYYYNQFA